MSKKTTSKTHIPLLMFILFLSLSTLFAVIVRKLGFTLESGFPEAPTTALSTGEVVYSKKLNFDPMGKFVYAVDVPLNYVRKTNKELAGVNYPKELLSLTDEELLSVKCSPLYRSGSNGFETFVRGVKVNMESGSEMQRVLGDKEKIAGAKMDYFQSCELENGSVLYNYGGTLNVGKTVYYFATKRDGINLDLKIDSGTDLSGVCDNVLAAKKDGTVYYRCGSEQGTTQTASIYAVDFSQSKIHRLIGCELHNVSSGRESNVSCKN